MKKISLVINPDQVDELMREADERPECPIVDASDSVQLNPDAENAQEEKIWDCPKCDDKPMYTDKWASFQKCYMCNAFLQDMESRHRLGLTIDDTIGMIMRGELSVGNQEVDEADEDEEEEIQQSSALEW